MAGADSDLEQGIASTELVNGNRSPRLGDGLFRVARSGTLRSVSSNLSRVSYVPLKYIRKTFTQRNGSVKVSLLSEADRAGQNEFFKVVLGSDSSPLPVTEAERLSAPCVLWYAKFLEGRFRSSWTTLARPALVGLSDMSNVPLPDEIGVVYRFMAEVAKLLLATNGLEMVGIVDELDLKLRLFKPQPDGERTIAYQLVFAALGWLTLLYDPAPAQATGQLQLRRSTGFASRPQRLIHASRTFTSYHQRDLDMYDHPIIMLLRKFGHLVPEIGPEPREEPEQIAVSYVCFSTLDKVADVKIEWVNSLSQHLEFDHVRRILKIFRFPSYCLLMCREVTLISKLYIDHCEFNKYLLESRLMGDIEDLTPEYFREILLSYRMIFGQNKASWTAFNKKIPAWGNRWNCSIGQSEDAGSERDQQDDDSDPMLLTLCGSSYDSPNARRIYEEIEAINDVAQYYHPHYEFPFFGRRILILQSFVKGRHPHNWKALWHDTRNVAFWWTFWAVLFIGGLTILLGLLQTAFQIWGSISGQRQLWASPPPP